MICFGYLAQPRPIRSNPQLTDQPIAPPRPNVVCCVKISLYFVLATKTASVGSWQKKSKIDHLWSSESIKERLCSSLFIPYLFSCIAYLQRGTNSRYRCVLPKAKNEVGSHPSHDATLTADLRVAKTQDIAVSLVLTQSCNRHAIRANVNQPGNTQATRMSAERCVTKQHLSSLQ